MKCISLKFFSLALIVIFIFFHCSQKERLSSESSRPLQIAVIPKGTTHEFWKSIHAGALQASKELGVEIMLMVFSARMNRAPSGLFVPFKKKAWQEKSNLLALIAVPNWFRP